MLSLTLNFSVADESQNLETLGAAASGAEAGAMAAGGKPATIVELFGPEVCSFLWAFFAHHFTVLSFKCIP